MKLNAIACAALLLCFAPTLAACGEDAVQAQPPAEPAPEPTLVAMTLKPLSFS